MHGLAPSNLKMYSELSLWDLTGWRDLSINGILHALQALKDLRPSGLT